MFSRAVFLSLERLKRTGDFESEEARQAAFSPPRPPGNQALVSKDWCATVYANYTSATKRVSSVGNPQKTRTTPLTTPRKALGDLSNNGVTPAVAKGTQSKPKTSGLGVKPGRKATVAPKSQPVRDGGGEKKAALHTAQQQLAMEDEFPPIETMPHTGNPGTDCHPPFTMSNGHSFTLLPPSPQTM